MKSKKDTAASFGERLRANMRAKGHTSTTSGSGVDVGALARVAGTSYEMARRYAEGLSVPRGDKLRAIASWLGVQVSALAWGETEQPGQGAGIDTEVLEVCLRAVEEAQIAMAAHLSPEQIASLVAVLYTEASAGRVTSISGVRGLVRAMCLPGKSSGREPSS